MIAIGIDPGRDGAAVAVEQDELGLHVRGSFLLAEVCPKWWAPGLVALALDALPRPQRVALELVASRPVEGSATSRRAGIGWGVLWACVALAWPGAELLTPASSVWTRVLRDQPGEGKARAVALVSSLLPDLNLTPGRRRKPHDGLADAGAIAIWALRRRGD